MSTSASRAGWRVIEHAGPVSGAIMFTVLAPSGLAFYPHYSADGITSITPEEGYPMTPVEELSVQAAVAEYLCMRMFR